MQEVYKWLIANYRLVLDVLAVIVAIILLVVRKKPVSAVLAAIYIFAIQGINEAETKGICGKAKLLSAVNYVINQLKQCYPKLDVTRYSSEIKIAIESILSTPQKKGD